MFKAENSRFITMLPRRFSTVADPLLAPLVNPSRSVIVIGFWRTGSTWLMESLGEILRAKLIFEPFNARVPGALALYLPTGRPDWQLNLPTYAPFVAGRLPAGGAAYAHVRAALRGGVRTMFVRQSRRRLGEAFRLRVAVKSVQGHLMAAAAARTFGCPLFILRRDPRAIMASIKQVKWMHIFRQLSLRGQLLGVEDGRAAVFERWSAQITAYEEGDFLQKAAVYWAALEWYLEESTRDLGAQAVTLDYEDLVLNPEPQIARILAACGTVARHAAEGKMSARASASTPHSEMFQPKDPQTRLLGWRSVLTPEEATAVEKIAGSFGLENRLWSPDAGEEKR
jgi:hypothetical protein